MKYSHNHSEAKIQYKGTCPACDNYMAIETAKTFLKSSLYELNVDHEDCEAEADKIVDKLKNVGITFSWFSV